MIDDTSKNVILVDSIKCDTLHQPELYRILYSRVDLLNIYILTINTNKVALYRILYSRVYLLNIYILTINTNKVALPIFYIGHFWL